MFIANPTAQFHSFSGVGQGSMFPNPFLDVASLSMPVNWRSVQYWCEHIFSSMGTYRMAMERINSYFLTEIDIKNASTDETDKWKGFLDGPLNSMTIAQSMLRARSCYGNSFASVVVPFKRFLACPRCGYQAPLKVIAENPKFNFRFVLNEPEKAFTATCVACKNHNGAWRVDDKDDDLEAKLRVKIWNNHEIETLHDVYSDDMAYLWRIPEDYKQQIRRGNLYQLERVPKDVLRAIYRNQMYRFHEDTIFHMKEPTLAGIYNRGLGIPRILMNFRQIYYVQVLRRFNEAIALDYVIPFRIITPAPAQGKSKGGSGSGSSGGFPIDPMSMFSGVDFRAQVNQMIRRRRRDPAAMQVLPFPVNFQMFGADANQLAPRDLLDQGHEVLLNDAGTPTELYNGSLQLQTAPVALRLFESTWRHLVHDINSFFSWLVRQLSQILSWESVDVELKRVTIADNLEEKMMAAQLMMSQQLSGTTVLGNMGYNWKKEQKQIGEEAQYQAEIASRTQEEMDSAGFAQQMAKGQQGGDPNAQGGGQAAAGGDPGAAAAMGAPTQGPVTQYMASLPPNAQMSVEDMMQVADSLAQQLLSGTPESIKDSELRKLKQAKPALHAMVRARMDQIRDDTNRAAGAAAQQQQGMSG